MGTRSLTRVFDDDRQLVNMYRQMDGYPSGHGIALFEFLDGLQLVNGISLTNAKERIANGPGCLAAQLVAHFKQGPGGIYLHPPADTNCDQEYEYHLTVRAGGMSEGGTLEVAVYDAAYRGEDLPPALAPLYRGDVAGFGAFCRAAEQ